MKNKIHVHIGGQNEVCGFELAENETVGSLIKRLCKEGHLGEFKPEEWSVCVEDSDEELAHDCRLEHGKHHRIHLAHRGTKHLTLAHRATSRDSRTSP